MDRNRFVKAAIFLGIVVFLAGLALFIYAGSFSRYWADDYCYSATIKQLGLFPGLADWYRNSGNRLSALAAVAFTELFGWRFIQFTTLLVLSLWVFAWLFFLNQVRRWMKWNVSWYGLALLALVQVYFAALLSPDRLQSIYWRMGALHYTLPMPLLLIELGLLIFGFRGSGKLALWMALLAALLAFFAAGLSETFAALQAGVFFMALAAGLLFLPRSRRGRVSGLLVPPLVATLLMMAIMSQAPANAWRQAVMPPPENLLLVIPYSLRYVGDFILYSLRGQVVPYLVFIASIAMVALLTVPAQSFRLPPRFGWGAVLAALLVMVALIVCSFAPSAYAGLAYPAGRALMPGCFVLLVGLGTAGFLLALTLRQALLARVRSGWLTTAAAALLVLLCLYPFRAVGAARADITHLSSNAARWDARHAQIMQALGSGTRDVVVRQVDVVQGLEDIGPRSDHWINICATIFYGAGSITANP